MQRALLNTFVLTRRQLPVKDHKHTTRISSVSYCCADCRLEYFTYSAFRHYARWWQCCSHVTSSQYSSSLKLKLHKRQVRQVGWGWGVGEGEYIQRHNIHTPGVRKISQLWRVPLYLTDWCTLCEKVWEIVNFIVSGSPARICSTAL
jgi:hypothetical protein